MNSTAVIVARFQTPFLHSGHTWLLNEIKARHNRLIVVLGVSPVKGSKRNPFDFYTRERMLKQFDASLVILPLKDEASDKVWSRNLDSLLHNSFPMEHFILYGSRDCFIPYYSGKLPVQELPEAGDISATSIREENADKVRISEDFRMGINYAYQNTYSKIYPTVDIAVLNADKTNVLLARKPNTGMWRFPGGFSDIADESFEAAAKRELQEECGAIETGEFTYIGSARIDDWRYRSEQDKIITTFFATTLASGKPVAGDDIEETRWFRLDEIPLLMANNMIAAEHIVLINMLIQFLNK
ncbi:MAG TPA: NUDIX domain-containing protein [Parafilimonas sp.]|nr:NUDIX domain-containing protein [Parafilimonas sp.]